MDNYTVKEAHRLRRRKCEQFLSPITECAFAQWLSYQPLISYRQLKTVLCKKYHFSNFISSRNMFLLFNYYTGIITFKSMDIDSPSNVPVICKSQTNSHTHVRTWFAYHWKLWHWNGMHECTDILDALFVSVLHHLNIHSARNDCVEASNPASRRSRRKHCRDSFCSIVCHESL